MSVRRLGHLLVAGVLSLCWTGCGAPDAVMRKMRAASELANADSMGVAPSGVQSIPTREPSDLVESSALVASHSQPDILFTFNDSGNDPVLFALSTTGATLARWRVSGASNRDWEAAASGPCASGTVESAGAPARSCLFIGDVGDNSTIRKSVSLYQVPEPLLVDSIALTELSADVLHVRYADGAHDVEAMYVAPNGTAYLITKRALKDAAGQLRQALVYAIPSDAWARHDTTIAELFDSLPIVPGSAEERQVTDASLSADSRLLAVRTYGQVFVFATDSLTGRVLHDVPPAVCNIMQTESRHGEGVTWMSGRPELILSSEGRNAPLHRITCPLPTR